jgi:hypothetical protein
MVAGLSRFLDLLEQKTTKVYKRLLLQQINVQSESGSGSKSRNDPDPRTADLDGKDDTCHPDSILHLQIEYLQIEY